MLRFLWVVTLLVTVGAHQRHDDAWQHNMKRFFDALNRDMNVALRKSFGLPVEVSTDSTYKTSSTTTRPTSGCISTMSTPDYHVSQPTVATSTDYHVSQPTEASTTDCEPNRGTTESSTQGYPIRVGSIRGIPGVNFPDYADIPLTSFSCSGKDYVPGFYADMETGCQVFHVCWPHRRESFLCPLGTIFNQALLACDYWYSSNCSLAPLYYDVNAHAAQSDKFHSKKDVNVGSMINVLLGAEPLQHSSEQSRGPVKESSLNPDEVLYFVSQFLPVKAKVTVYPGTADTLSKIVATASVGKVKHSNVHHGKHLRHKLGPQSDGKFPSTVDETASEPQFLAQPLSPSLQKYVEVESTVRSVINEVFETVQNIIREAQGVLAIQKSSVPARDKHFPLTKLNPRFIVEPVTLSKDTSERPPDVNSASEGVSVSSSTEHPVAGIPEKPLQPKIPRRPELRVSPITKQALTTNYLKLLKIRKA